MPLVQVMLFSTGSLQLTVVLVHEVGNVLERCLSEDVLHHALHRRFPLADADQDVVVLLCELVVEDPRPIPAHKKVRRLILGRERGDTLDQALGDFTLTRLDRDPDEIKGTALDGS